MLRLRIIGVAGHAPIFNSVYNVICGSKYLQGQFAWVILATSPNSPVMCHFTRNTWHRCSMALVCERVYSRQINRRSRRHLRKAPRMQQRVALSRIRGVQRRERRYGQGVHTAVHKGIGKIWELEQVAFTCAQHKNIGIKRGRNKIGLTTAIVLLIPIH
jgi:hypothetical protein